jgi:microcystin-dependent protein
MSLVDSNTYVEPTGGTSLSSARSQWNNANRSLLTNFKSTAVPVSLNLVASGAGIGEQDGMLFRSATTNALYISDTVHKKSSPVGGNFTRVGIGNRVENGIVALTGNIASYEIGELVATPSDSGALSGNARLYLKTGNATNMTDLIDVGIPPTNGSITNTMIALGSISADRLQDGNVTLQKADFTTGSGDGGSGATATLKISSTSTADTSIGFSTRNTTANVSLGHIHGSAGITAGLNVKDQAGNYSSLAANLATQSAIQGGTTSPVVLIPAGSIIAWAGSSAPSGWLLCDGSAISRTTYAALFAVTATVYGVGDGSGTFNLPDSRDRILLGAGTNNSRGGQGGTFAASSALTTASSTAALSYTAAAVSSSAKDASTTNVVGNDLAAGGHTHTLSVPRTVTQFIIKT